MTVEHERRFLVAAHPAGATSGDVRRIVQGYLTTSPAAIRVRRVDDGECTLTIKAGAGVSRTEIERTIDADEFEALWALATELRIEKRRYPIALAGGLVAELDRFDGDLAGRSIVEVEFASTDEAAAFDPPDWFGREVTDDGRYTNAAIARHGWPADGPDDGRPAAERSDDDRSVTTDP